MREVTPDPDDLAYVLRPESATRNLAMRAHGWTKHLRGFRILHDHHQWHTHLFEKYALRELRSRTPQQRGRLDGAMATWGDDDDHRVARSAIAHAREHIRADAPSAEVHAYICALPRLAAEVVPALGLSPQEPLSIDDLPPPGARAQRPPVFGLGLSRTGTRSLTAALHVLGWHTVHYPTDADTLSTLARGDADFRLLEQFDGLTDITVSHLYRELDRRFPDARFVLTVRDEEAWLDSCRRHWDGRPAWDDPTKSGVHLEIRRFLRAAVYGCYAFEPQRFREVYRAHVRDVVAYFADRPEKLLVLPLTDGAGWRPLCDFLGAPVPAEPMPHKGGGLKARQPGLELRD
jgi:hypothetical protein